MKIELDRKTKMVLLHWLKNGCIDTEELKTLEDGHLLADGGSYDFADFTDDELMQFHHLINKATVHRHRKERQQ